MSTPKTKKTLGWAIILICIAASLVLIVITNLITRIAMEPRLISLQQQMDAEKAVYQQRIASLLERLEAGKMTDEGIAKTYDEYSNLDELLIRVRWTDSELDRLNAIIYHKLLQRYPESAAKILMDELRGEHGDWALHFMTDYVTDNHLRPTLILSLRTMVKDERNRQLRERAQQVLARYGEKTD